MPQSIGPEPCAEGPGVTEAQDKNRSSSKTSRKRSEYLRTAAHRMAGSNFMAVRTARSAGSPVSNAHGEQDTVVPVLPAGSILAAATPELSRAPRMAKANDAPPTGRRMELMGYASNGSRAFFRIVITAARSRDGSIVTSYHHTITLSLAVTPEQKPGRFPIITLFWISLYSRGAKTAGNGLPTSRCGDWPGRIYYPLCTSGGAPACYGTGSCLPCGDHCVYPLPLRGRVPGKRQNHVNGAGLSGSFSSFFLGLRARSRFFAR